MRRTARGASLAVARREVEGGGIVARWREYKWKGGSGTNSCSQADALNDTTYPSGLFLKPLPMLKRTQRPVKVCELLIRWLPPGREKRQLATGVLRQCEACWSVAKTPGTPSRVLNC
eukprot:778099-Rhodomonas_salina.4